MTAFKPGASPPPVEMAILTVSPPDQLQHLTWLGVAPERTLGEDQISVHRHLEDTARRRHQPDLSASGNSRFSSAARPVARGS